MTAQGQIVTTEGDTVLPSITVPANSTNVTISQYGVVTATIPGQTAPAQLGIIQLATFANPGGLNSIGGNLFLQSSSSGNAITEAPGGSGGLGTLQQGYLENSNVDVVAEFVQMILAQARLREQLQGRPRGRRHVLPDQQHRSVDETNAHILLHLRHSSQRHRLRSCFRPPGHQRCDGPMRSQPLRSG